MAEEILLITDDDQPIGLDELLEASGLVHDDVIELVAIGVFQPLGRPPSWSFHARTLRQARRAARLRDTFGLNAPGMALALTYLERMEALESRLRELESLLPRA